MEALNRPHPGRRAGERHRRVQISVPLWWDAKHHFRCPLYWLFLQVLGLSVGGEFAVRFAPPWGKSTFCTPLWCSLRELQVGSKRTEEQSLARMGPWNPVVEPPDSCFCEGRLREIQGISVGISQRNGLRGGGAKRAEVRGVAPANQTKKRARTRSSWISPIFVNSGVFSLGKPARFTSNFCSCLPPGKVHELAFLWFGLPGWLLSEVRGIKSRFPVGCLLVRFPPTLRPTLSGDLTKHCYHRNLQDVVSLTKEFLISLPRIFLSHLGSRRNSVWLQGLRQMGQDLIWKRKHSPFLSTKFHHPCPYIFCACYSERADSLNFADFQAFANGS